MVKVAYIFRIVCDKHFLTWILNQEETKRREILRKLMFIKSSSLHHTKTHNVILGEDFNDEGFQRLVTEKLPEGENLRGAVKPREKPDFLKDETDEISKYIKYAIYLTNNKPYKCCIFTNVEKEPEYIKNKHLKPITNTVIIKSGEEAINIINKLYKSFETQRMLEH